MVETALDLLARLHSMLLRLAFSAFASAAGLKRGRTHGSRACCQHQLCYRLTSYFRKSWSLRGDIYIYVIYIYIYIYACVHRLYTYIRVESQAVCALHVITRSIELLPFANLRVEWLEARSLGDLPQKLLAAT